MTTVEAILNSIFKVYTTNAKNGSITTGGSYTALGNGTVRARIVYISNTSGETLLVRQGGVDFILPDGAIFPFNNISTLADISVKVSDDSETTISFRYEY
jgi:hypothetical protein